MASLCANHINCNGKRIQRDGIPCKPLKRRKSRPWFTLIESWPDGEATQVVHVQAPTLKAAIGKVSGRVLYAFNGYKRDLLPERNCTSDCLVLGCGHE